MQCAQDNCNNEATHRYTWPGRDESYVCDDHLPKLRMVANAMGLYLQVIPLALILLLIVSCSGPSFNARNNDNTRDSGMGSGWIDSNVNIDDSSVFTIGSGGATANPQVDSGILQDARPSMGGALPLGTGGRTEESGGSTSIQDSGLPVNPCADCKVGTFNEQPCCKLLPEAHCGVIFKGDNRSCIDWR